MARMPFVVGAVAALTLIGGCGLVSKPDKPAAAQLPTISPTSPQPVFTTDPVTVPATTAATPSPSRTTKKPTAKATTKAAAAPTEPPFWYQLPACAHRDSSKLASKSQVKAVLEKAAVRVYWQHEAPSLRINYPLIKAVAWQESGWQSNIHNCDGGVGVMQVMPDTVTTINNRFGLDYDVTNLQDNAYLGGNYLAWLTRYAGEKYFGGSYDLSSSKCKSTTSWCLLNAVISGYNGGSGAVDNASVGKTFSNPAYVASVRALMSRCQCDQY